MTTYRGLIIKTSIKLVEMMETLGCPCMILLFLSLLVSQILAFAVFKLDGEYAWSEIPAPVRYSMLAIAFFFSLVLVSSIGPTVLRGIVNRAILTKGQPTIAKILQVRNTGTTINNDPMLKILLEVYPPNQAPFQAEAEQIISCLQIPQVQPGVLVQVKYDPDSHAAVIIPNLDGSTDRTKSTIYGIDRNMTDTVLIQQEGREGIAKLLSIEDSGRFKDSNPIVRITYKVFIPYEELYEVTKEVPIPTPYIQLLRMVIGKSFPARVHPHDHKKMEVNIYFQ